MLYYYRKVSFSPEPRMKSNLLLPPSSPTHCVMREYFPWVWKHIQAVLLETLLNQPNQLFLCLPSFWWVTTHSIRLVNVNIKLNFCWVLLEISSVFLGCCWKWFHIFQDSLFQLHRMWGFEQQVRHWRNTSIPLTKRDCVFIQKPCKTPAEVESFIELPS